MLLVVDNNLYVEANFTEKDFTHIRDNQPAEINVDQAPPGPSPMMFRPTRKWAKPGITGAIPASTLTSPHSWE